MTPDAARAVPLRGLPRAIALALAGLDHRVASSATAPRCACIPTSPRWPRLAGLSVELASRSVGARLQRRRGEGTEFQELRDYRVGDSLRKIDWKATARSSRLISREYRDERNQQVVLMLDCGRRMLAQDDQLAHFDHVLNASLALASIALRQGDAVGMLACSGQQQRWLPPQQGSGGMDMLLGAGYDLQAMPSGHRLPGRGQRAAGTPATSCAGGADHQRARRGRCRTAHGRVDAVQASPGDAGQPARTGARPCRRRCRRRSGGQHPQRLGDALPGRARTRARRRCAARASTRSTSVAASCPVR